jgi:hypothetical protein
VFVIDDVLGFGADVSEERIVSIFKAEGRDGESMFL